MNQDVLGPATEPASADILLAKRKRGRPRKDDSTVQGSNTSASSKVRRQNRKDDLGSSDNVAIGQRVTGVLDGSLDAGYFLTVRVGDTNMVLRGLVFEPGLAVPVCSANDVAPHVKMFQRTDLSTPAAELKNPRPVYGHSLQSVSKSPVSVKSFQIISSQQNIHFDGINGSLSKPSSRQSEKVNCSNDLFHKGASTVAPLAVDGVKVAALQLHVVSPEAKENETTPRQVLPRETGEASFSTSQFEGGRHNTKETVDVNVCAQPEGSYIDGKEVSLGTPRVLLPADKTPCVNDTEIRNKDYTEGMVLDTELKMGTSQSEAEAEKESRVLSSDPGSHKCGGNQRKIERILSRDQMDDTDIQETGSQSLHVNRDGDRSDQFSQAKEGVIFTDAPAVASQHHQSEEKSGQLNEMASSECILPTVDSLGGSNSIHDASQHEEYPITKRDQSVEMVELKREADIQMDLNKSALETAAPKDSPIVEESIERHKDDTVAPSPVCLGQSVAVPAAEPVDDSNLGCHGASPHEVYPIIKSDHSVEEMITGDRKIDIPMAISDFEKSTSSTATPKGSPSTIKVEDSSERHMDVLAPLGAGICQSVEVPAVEPAGDANLSFHDASLHEAGIPLSIPDVDKSILPNTAPKGFPNKIKVEDSYERHEGDVVVPSEIGLCQPESVPGKSSSPGVIRDEQLLEGDYRHQISNANLNHVSLDTTDLPLDEPVDLQVGLLVRNDTEIPDASE